MIPGTSFCVIHNYCFLVTTQKVHRVLVLHFSYSIGQVKNLASLNPMGTVLKLSELQGWQNREIASWFGYLYTVHGYNFVGDLFNQLIKPHGDSFENKITVWKSCMWFENLVGRNSVGLQILRSGSFFD